MLNKLKRKFIILATVATFALMSVLVAIMNVIDYSVVVKESDATIDVIAHTYPAIFDKDKDDKPDRDDTGKPDDDDDDDDKIPPQMSPEVAYEARFFTVDVSPDGEIVNADFSRILSVDRSSVDSYVTKALASDDKRGFVGEFRYAKRTNENGRETTILFLDCGRKFDSFRSFLWTSVLVGLGGCVVVFIAFVFLSGKIVNPIAESYKKQKRFISDAGHEMKTPLTIINANLDLLECDGESEELEDIRAQTKRMTELTNNLVYLSKMDEPDRTIKKIEMPLSDLVSETANSFRAIAVSKNLDYTVTVASGVTLCGAPDEIRELVSVLIENAVKYSPERGKTTVDLSVNKKSATLTVLNETATEVKKEDLPFVFDRFYRMDASRNSSTGGHGIGLSIAKAVVTAHDGTIRADTVTGKDFKVTVVLPVR